jgi:hypothetical protein
VGVLRTPVCVLGRASLPSPGLLGDVAHQGARIVFRVCMYVWVRASVPTLVPVPRLGLYLDLGLRVCLCLCLSPCLVSRALTARSPTC